MPSRRVSVPPEAIRIEDEVWQEAFAREASGPSRAARAASSRRGGPVAADAEARAAAPAARPVARRRARRARARPAAQRGSGRSGDRSHVDLQPPRRRRGTGRRTVTIQRPWSRAQPALAGRDASPATRAAPRARRLPARPGRDVGGPARGAAGARRGHERARVDARAAAGVAPPAACASADRPSYACRSRR